MKKEGMMKRNVELGVLDLVLLDLLLLVIVLLEIVLLELVPLMYGTHTFGSCSCEGSWVKNPSFSPSRYDLDIHQDIDR
jgi:hypothetical protein